MAPQARTVCTRGSASVAASASTSSNSMRSSTDSLRWILPARRSTSMASRRSPRIPRRITPNSTATRRAWDSMSAGCSRSTSRRSSRRRSGPDSVRRRVSQERQLRFRGVRRKHQQSGAAQRHLQDARRGRGGRRSANHSRRHSRRRGDVDRLPVARRRLRQCSGGSVDPDNFTIDDGVEFHAGFEYLFDVQGFPALRAGIWRDPDHAVHYDVPANPGSDR